MERHSRDYYRQLPDEVDPEKTVAIKPADNPAEARDEGKEDLLWLLRTVGI